MYVNRLSRKECALLSSLSEEFGLSRSELLGGDDSLLLLDGGELILFDIILLNYEGSSVLGIS